MSSSETCIISGRFFASFPVYRYYWNEGLLPYLNKKVVINYTSDNMDLLYVFDEDRRAVSVLSHRPHIKRTAQQVKGLAVRDHLLYRQVLVIDLIRTLPVKVFPPAGSMVVILHIIIKTDKEFFY